MWKRLTCAEKLCFVFVLLTAAALSTELWLVLHPNEPGYQGKGLTAWLRQHYNYSNFDPYGEQSKARLEEAETAIRHIGTNALPVLLKMARTKRTSPKSVIAFYFWAEFQARKDPLVLAEVGFQTLGPIAKPAVPALLDLLNDQDLETRRDGAIYLGEIGPAAEDAVPALLQHLADTNAYSSVLSIEYTWRMEKGRHEFAVASDTVKVLIYPRL